MSKGTLNKVCLIGRIGKDPELKYTSGGSAICNFTLATDDSYTKDATEVAVTDWHRCVAWRKLAEICGQYLKKGALVYVEGKLKSRSYGDGDAKKYVTEIVVGEMTMLGEKKEKESEPQPIDDMEFLK